MQSHYQEKVYCKRTFGLAYRTQMDAFQQKKWFKTTEYFRTFFTLLSCSSIGSITPPLVVFPALFRKFVALHPYSCYRLLEE